MPQLSVSSQDANHDRVCGAGESLQKMNRPSPAPGHARVLRQQTTLGTPECIQEPYSGHARVLDSEDEAEDDEESEEEEDDDWSSVDDSL